jgi:hypothetical protein
MFGHVELIYRGGTESAGEDAEVCDRFSHVFREVSRDLPAGDTAISGIAYVAGSSDLDIELFAEAEHFVATRPYSISVAACRTSPTKSPALTLVSGGDGGWPDSDAVSSRITAWK